MWLILPPKNLPPIFASKIIDSLRARLRERAKRRIPRLRGIRVRELVTSFLLAISIAGVDATNVVVAPFFTFLVARIFSCRDLVVLA